MYPERCTLQYLCNLVFILAATAEAFTFWSGILWFTELQTFGESRYQNFTLSSSSGKLTTLARQDQLCQINVVLPSATCLPSGDWLLYAQDPLRGFKYVGCWTHLYVATKLSPPPP